MKSQKTVRWIDITLLKDEQQPYQRPIEKTRLKKIKDKMMVHGFHSYKPIVVNQTMQIVDGQHRTKSAKDLNFSEVPVVQVTYDSYDEEAKAFVELNEDRTQLSPLNEFAARKEYGCPIANLIYKLNEDRNSPLYRKIELRGSRARTDGPKFTITSVGQLLTTVLFKLRSDHFKAIKGDYERKINDLDYDEVIRKLHVFWNWFKEFELHHFAGENKYPQMVLPPIFITFLNLREQGFLSQNNMGKQIAKRIKTFPFDVNFRKSDRIPQIQSMSTFLMSKYTRALTTFDPWRSYYTV